MAKKVPNLPGIQPAADVPTVEHLQAVPVYPSRIGTVKFKLDFSGSTVDSHGNFRGLVGLMVNEVLAHYPQAARRVWVSINAMTGGLYPGPYQPLEAACAPEFVAGGDSPILGSASRVGDLTLAEHRVMLQSTRIVASKIVVATDCIDKVVSEQGQTRAAQGWQDFLAASPLTTVTLIVPNADFPRHCAKLLLRPEQSLDDVIILKDALSMGPKLFEQFALVLRDISKTVTGSGSNKMIKAPVQPMVLNTED